MNLKLLYSKTHSLFIEPVTIWNRISEERLTRREVVIDYLFPMAVLIGLCATLGMLISEGLFDSFSISYLLLNGIISFFVIFLEVYLSGWLITELGVSFDNTVSSHRVFNLVVYSQAPFYLALAFTRLFPQLFFAIIAGIYSFYLFWNGIEIQTGLHNEKRNLFFVLSSLVMILMFLILSLVFNSIYDSVLNRFSTFGG